MKTLFLSLAQFLGVLLLADFIAGVVHWLEDAYGEPETAVLGPLVIQPNIVHHHYPRYFTKLSWWESSWMLCAAGAVVVGAAWWAGCLTWQVWLFVMVSANANQVHKWSHQSRTENGRVISFLQDIRLLLTPRQHALHHTDPKNTYYCPVTNLLNPMLERLDFWNRLEAAIEKTTGLKRRPDSSLRGSGAKPEWLAAFAPKGAIQRQSPARAEGQELLKAGRCRKNCAHCVRCQTCPGKAVVKSHKSADGSDGPSAGSQVEAPQGLAAGVAVL